jgi:hypothetical protein
MPGALLSGAKISTRALITPASHPHMVHFPRLLLLLLHAGQQQRTHAERRICIRVCGR